MCIRDRYKIGRNKNEEADCNMKQIYEDLSDDTDFDIIDLDDVPDRDTVKRRKRNLKEM